jgi:hypothetical protein
MPTEPSGTATVTAPIGPDLDATALVLTNVVNIDFQLNRGILQITQSSPSKITDFALSGSNTITLTASAGAYTLTVS